MATPRTCLTSLTSLTKAFTSPLRLTATTSIQSSLPFLCPIQQARGIRLRPKVKKDPRKKKRREFIQYNLKDAIQFSLCDAMRYIRAIEVGRDPTVPKYELHIRLRTRRDGPTIRNQIRLPHSVKTDLRIGVICPPDIPLAAKAKVAGASIVGEDDLIDSIKGGKIEFDRLLCHTNSIAKLNKAGLGRILGPRGLMPSTKMGTITEDPAAAIGRMTGGGIYRERDGVVRMAVGQLGFTPEEMRHNVKAFVEAVKKDAAVLSEHVPKEIYEVVLSSTNGPGFSLSGEFKTPESPNPAALSVL